MDTKYKTLTSFYSETKTQPLGLCKKKKLHFALFCDAVNSTSGVYSLLFLVLTEPE